MLWRTKDKRQILFCYRRYQPATQPKRSYAAIWLPEGLLRGFSSLGINLKMGICILSAAKGVSRTCFCWPAALYLQKLQIGLAASAMGSFLDKSLMLLPMINGCSDSDQFLEFPGCGLIVVCPAI